MQSSDLEGDRPFIVEKVRAVLRSPYAAAIDERTGS
ncbi:UNVERIFIED_ORG: hypothetical protein J2X79_001000 [Arthrobacter globiformis]|nr:hypothetical protein [Arthrobacter globiformis]